MKNRFVLVAPMFNASATLPHLLHSLCGQSYNNWRLHLIDDRSDLEHEAEIQEILFNFQAVCPNPSDRIQIQWNTQKRWEVANVLDGIKTCEPNDIICRIDPDDYLCDLDALRIIDTVYTETGCEVLWTKHRWFDDKRVTNFNISAPMATDADPYTHPWVTSHFKTFRKYLIDDVNDANFRGEDGEYIKRAGDQAIFLPILHQTQKRMFLPLVTYAYRCNLDPETFQTEDAKFQRREGEFIRSRGFVK